MDYAKYEQALTSLVTNPDSAAIAVQDILKDLKTDCETFASMEASVTEKDGRIKDLQNVNMQLFLRQTGGAQEQEPEEEKPKTFEEKLFELDKQNKGE